jgi:hypothetical protein
MINKKPIGKKPIPRRAPPVRPQAAAPQEGAPEADAAPESQAATNEPEDELALQQVDTTSYPGENFKRPERAKPDDTAAKRIDFDPHSLLIFAWIGLGLFVAGGVIYFFYSGKTSIDDTVKRPDTPPAAKSSTSTSTGADKKAPAVNTSNPANRAGYQQITAFLQQAYKEQSSIEGEALSAKMMKEVPLTGADDPDVREYRDKLCEYFRLGKEHPLRPPEATDAAAGELVGNRGGMSADGVARQKIEKRYTELAITLKNRYK